PDARGAIVFEPDPPRIRRAIDHLAMGSVTKVDFAFEELPWTRFAPARYREERAGVGFLRTPGSAFNVWWSLSPVPTPQAVAWSGGPAASALARRPREEIISTALRDLGRALGIREARLRALVRRCWTHDWEHDPFARGAYSYPLVGGSGAGRALA